MKGLIVTGDPELKNRLKLIIKRDNIKIDVSMDGYTCLQRVKNENFDFIIISSDISDIDGVTLCKTINFNDKKYNYPIIFFIGENLKQKQRNLILESGANDCMDRSFDNKEFTLRLKNHLNMKKKFINISMESKNGQNTISSKIKYANLTIDPKKIQIVERDGRPNRVPQKEYELLKYFILNKGKVLSRESIRKKVWKVEKTHKADRRVDICVCRLKKRFAILNSTLSSIRGIGYSLKDIVNI
ncbi:MAG: response regulator transcription factor [Fusobacteriota bacterium]